MIRNTREFLANRDAENAHQTTQLTTKQRKSAVARNLFEAKLESSNAIPGINKFSAPISVLYGLGKIGYGGALFLSSLSASRYSANPDPEPKDDLGKQANSYVLSGLKTATLGAVALIPVVGWIPNAIAAGLEVVDAANAALPPPKE